MPTTFNIGQYKTWTRNRIKRPSYDSTRLLQFADEANKEIVNKRQWRFMEEEFTGTIAQGFNNYDYPDDFQALINFKLVDPDNNARFLRFIPYEVWDQKWPDVEALTPAAPRHWTSYGPNLVVGPALPDADYTMTLRYLKMPKDLSTAADDITPDITDDFKELMVLGMARRALEASDQYNQAQVLYQEWLDMMDDMHDRLQSRQFGEPSVMGSPFANNTQGGW